MNDTVENDSQRRTYEVWSEGYSATGEHGTAYLVGTVGARSFREACNLLLWNRDDYDRDNLRLWGCRLFDNEQDARRSWG